MGADVMQRFSGRTSTTFDVLPGTWDVMQRSEAKLKACVVAGLFTHTNKLQMWLSTKYLFSEPEVLRTGMWDY